MGVGSSTHEEVLQGTDYDVEPANRHGRSALRRDAQRRKTGEVAIDMKVVNAHLISSLEAGREGLRVTEKLNE